MCAVARARLQDADRETIAGVWRSAAVDLRTLPMVLHRHGLVPLTSRHLAASDPPVPSSIRLWLAKALRETAAQQAQATDRLCDLLDGFDAASLDVLPYKGPILSVQLYGDAAMRQPGDLDLLVRPAHAQSAIAFLLDRGFIPEDSVESNGRLPLLRHRHACSLRDPITDLAIDVHWRLLDRMYGPELSLDWLMDQPQTVNVGDRRVRTMAGERLWLALCLHGAAHQWDRLIWLADVAQLMRSYPDLRWPLILEQAARLRFTRGLAAALILVRELFGDGVASGDVAALLGDAGAHALAGRIVARFESAESAPLSMAERFRLGWLGRESLLDRARFGWQAATHVSSRDLGASAWSRVPGVANTRRVVRLLREAAAGRIGAPDA